MTRTIEQLTARVRELEEENARLKAAVEYAETIRVENIAYFEKQLATAEQRVAEAIVDMLQQKHRNCFGAHNLYLAASVATKNGEWRKFVKEV